MILIHESQNTVIQQTLQECVIHHRRILPLMQKTERNRMEIKKIRWVKFSLPPNALPSEVWPIN
jgi:hypothetical protein